VADEPSFPVDEERLGESGDAVGVLRFARPVVDEWVRDPVGVCKAARVPREVLRVDADNDDAALSPLLPGRLEQRRLALAGHTPRRPEVEHNRLAAERSQLQLPGRVEARQREVRRRALRDVRLVRELPDQQGEQAGDTGEREPLRPELQLLRHCR
jgi:hypothetical protein